MAEQLVRELGNLLPLDEESLGQMVHNAQQLPSHGAIAEYWLGLLGESPGALDFITHFTSDSSARSCQSRPVSRPVSTPQSTPTRSLSLATRSQNANVNTTTSTSKNARGGTTTSELLDEPVEKLCKQSAKREKQRRVDNLKDLESILNQLDSQAEGSGGSKCDCQATRHALFEVVPNCLNCGKIICVKEGLSPCSFCGHKLVSSEEKASIVQYLETERSSLEDVKPKEVVEKKKNKKNKVTLASGAGVNLWKQQEALFKKLDAEKSRRAEEQKRKREEAKQVEEQDQELKFYANQQSQDPDLMNAQANLENLLSFQANSAERTKIIDQASDFELPTGSNLNIWSSGVEKALQLKKQQKQLRKQEKKEDALRGRGKKVLDITIGRDGKAVMREVKAVEESDSEDDEIDRMVKDIEQQKKKKNEQDFQAVWDYKKDQNKWERPQYSGESASETSDKKTYHWGRVQQAQPTSGDLEELVAAI